MKGETRELWRKLCEEAANEQDPQRLIELVDKIDEMLLEKEQRLQEQRKIPASTTSGPGTDHSNGTA